MHLIDQLVASDNALALCQQYQVAPLLSYALFRHFCQTVDTNRPLIQLDYTTLYALSAADEPRTLESLVVIALGHMKRDLRREKQVGYARIEYTPDSYKARFKYAGERYVFHLQQRNTTWSMTLCYASDD